ncbi:MAG: MFS transporter [Syntrophobacteraceae bacterium]
MLNQTILSSLPRDAGLLFLARAVRLFAYGAISVILVMYLAEIGLSGARIGLLLTLTLLGDTLISLWITMVADRVGRKRMLLLGSALMLLAGLVFSIADSFFLLLLAATLGIISPSGNEVGPFLSIEQASLSHILPDKQRTSVFAWYNLFGSSATALGALACGGVLQLLQSTGSAALTSYRVVIVGYALLGLLLGILFARLSSSVEICASADECKPSPPVGVRFGLHRSRGVVFKLSALFSLDAFAGGFVLQSIMAYWFYLRFGAEPGLIGSIFFGANILAGISALLASRVADRIGLIRTMVFTHIPSNILLMLVPIMPNLPLAIAVLLLRFSISQMDVPTRQSYTMAVVSPEERSTAAGVTGIARTLGAALSPTLAGPLLAHSALMNLPFFLGGGLKIIYDLLLYLSFKSLKPPEEEESA